MPVKWIRGDAAATGTAYRIAVAISISAASFLCGAFAAGNNWMGDINGNTPLSRISIPGTHDSGARCEPLSGTAKCQNATIAEQLDCGVRLLDIRCRHINNSFDIYHGATNQHLTFREALDQVTGFLHANPGECVILSVKEESTPSAATRSFEATFDSYVATDSERWWLGMSVPILHTVRGKIVLLRRFGALAGKGINATTWPDNTTFLANNLRVQDAYQAGDNTTKWKHIGNALSSAFADNNADILHLNFASGYQPGLFGLPDITAVSDMINPLLAGYFGKAPRGHYGCVLMDFADAKRSALIYNTNFTICERR